MMVRKQLSCEPDAQRSATIKATPHYVVVCVRGDERGVYLWDYFWTKEGYSVCVPPVSVDVRRGGSVCHPPVEGFPMRGVVAAFSVYHPRVRASL